MKRVLISCGGMGTAWHICKIAEEYFKGSLEMYICDAADSDLIPSALIAKECFKVPMGSGKDYADAVKKLIVGNSIDAYIPLVPSEVITFYKDSDFVREHNLFITSPVLKTVQSVFDKKDLNEFLIKHDIPTPKVVRLDAVGDDKRYIIKPREGYGSIDVEVIKGEDLKYKADKGDIQPEEYIIQEFCENAGDEVTVEVYNGSSKVKMFARKRITIKSGACTKTEPVSLTAFENTIEKIMDDVELPIASNLQFINHEGQWKLIDFNLRMGAGFGLSTAMGFQLTRAVLAEIAGEDVKDEWFEVDKSIKKVLRVYQELVVR